MSFSFESPNGNLGEKILDIIILKPNIFNDERGFFMESWNQQKFNRAINSNINFVQDNHSKSKFGVLRGLHYQTSDRAQGKLVRCISGEIFDVAVDIRTGSKSYGQWVGIKLDSVNHNQIWIPEGFAHGFLTLSETAEVIYKTTEFWSSDHEMTIRWNDPEININWPQIEIDPILSVKDSKSSFLKDIRSSHLF